MSDILNSSILVLNKSWVPVHIKSAKDAICDVVAECARIIDTEDDFLQMHDWVASGSCACGSPDCRGWSSLPATEKSKVVRTARSVIRLPEVIVLSDYNEVPELEIKLTRRNLLLRDNFRCQYCGEKVSAKDFTIDHVMPRSRGGLNAWDNFVVACFPCNIKKRDRTPKEAGLTLRGKPAKPKWYPLASRYSMNSPQSWKRFLPEKAVPSLI